MEVSVLMAVHNVALYLEDAVESVLAQEGPEFELLIGDDASTDDAWNILQKYARDSRVRLFRNEQNRGAGATRNALAREARGRFLVPCDPDDSLLPGNLAEHHRELCQHPECSAVYSGLLALEFDEEQRLTQPPRVNSLDYREYWDLKENTINHGGSMIDRQRFLEVGGYEEDVRRGEDWALWLRLVDLAPFHYHAGFVGYLYRRHPRQITKERSEAIMQDHVLVVRRTVERRYGKKAGWD